MDIIRMFFLCLLITQGVYSQVDEEIIIEKKRIWINMDDFDFLGKKFNKRLHKDALKIISSHEEYEIAISDHRQINRILRPKRSTVVFEFKITPYRVNGRERFKIYGVLKDLKKNNIIRRVRRKNITQNSLILISNLAIRLLFTESDKEEFRKISQKIKEEIRLNSPQIIEEKQSPPPQEYDIKAAINQIKTNLKKKNTVLIETREEKEVEQKSKENEKNDNQRKSLLSQQKKNAPPEPALPSFFIPRESLFIQGGLDSQNYLLKENYQTTNEFEIKTQTRFLTLRGVYAFQLSENYPIDLWLEGRYGSPISKTTVKLTSYKEFQSYISYAFNQDGSFPFYFAATFSYDNPGFANVPVRGEGIQTSSISVFSAGAKAAMLFYDKSISLGVRWEHSIYSLIDETSLNSDTYNRARWSAELTIDTNEAFPNSNISLQYSSSLFNGLGNRAIDGSNASFFFLIGYII